MLEWFQYLDHQINGRSSVSPVNNNNLQGVYAEERTALVQLIYKIPYKFDLVEDEFQVNSLQNQKYYSTQYTAFSNDSRDVYCRTTIYNNVRSILQEMSVWNQRFRAALNVAGRVQYDTLYNQTMELADEWMSVAADRIVPQALAHSRAIEESGRGHTSLVGSHGSTKRKKHKKRTEVEKLTPTPDLATLLAQLRAPGPTVSTPVYSDEENTPSRVWVHVVHVLLRPGEEYQDSTSYHGRKLVVNQHEVVSGIHKPWDVIKNCHEFSVPMHLEQECIEILWFKRGYPHNSIFEVWQQGQAQQVMSAYPFLFKKDWNISGTGLRLGDGDHIEIRLQPRLLQEEPRHNTEAQRASSRTSRHRHVPAPRPARTS